LSRLLGMLHPAVEVLVHCAAADVDIRAAVDVHPHERGPVASRGGLACERHFLGLTQLVQLLLPAMRAQGRGRIVQVSGAMRAGTTPQSAWVTASQTALTVWLACLRMELLPFGVHVVQIGVPPPGRFPNRRAVGENPGMGLTMVAQLLRQAVRSRSPAAHLTPGWQHRVGQLIQQTLQTRAVLWCRARWPAKPAVHVAADRARAYKKPLPDEVDVHDLLH
jgi:NAD(P)-dependent dehydrogenase (short-subunit alcohol dehydrogenase family)